MKDDISFDDLCEMAFRLTARPVGDYLNDRVNNWRDLQKPLDKEARAPYDGNAPLELAEFAVMTALSDARDYIEAKFRRMAKADKPIVMTGRDLGELLLESGLDLSRHLRGEVRPSPSGKKGPARPDLH